MFVRTESNDLSNYGIKPGDEITFSGSDVFAGNTYNGTDGGNFLIPLNISKAVTTVTATLTNNTVTMYAATGGRVDLTNCQILSGSPQIRPSGVMVGVTTSVSVTRNMPTVFAPQGLKLTFA